MFVCLCNGIRESAFAEAIERNGCGEAREAFNCLGCSPVCGRCVDYVQEMTELSADQKKNRQ